MLKAGPEGLFTPPRAVPRGRNPRFRGHKERLSAPVCDRMTTGGTPRVLESPQNSQNGKGGPLEKTTRERLRL